MDYPTHLLDEVKKNSKECEPPITKVTGFLGRSHFY